MVKVFVSGCFDLLHSCHILFLDHAATYGTRLYVSVGSDETIRGLKGRTPTYVEDERVYMIQALACVYHAFVGSGSGMLDFEPNLREMRPNVFVVGNDGDTPEKRRLCEELGIVYVTISRNRFAGIERSTTNLRSKQDIPYRVDLAGGWLDQPYVSKYADGPVITASLEPTIDFNLRSGMATSTRNHAIEMWGHAFPRGNSELLARQLFCFDNPPGTEYVSGSQDALGIILPGLNRLDYRDGNYWPYNIESERREEVLQFVESHLYFLPLGPRPGEFNPLKDTCIDRERVKELSAAACDMWGTLTSMDSVNIGWFMQKSFEAQIAMFPNMVTEEILAMMRKLDRVAYGYKLSGAGGGGYIVAWSDIPIDGAIQATIRRGASA